MNVQAAELGAAVQLRENFSGIEQAFGVEGTFDPLLLIEVDLREHGVGPVTAGVFMFSLTFFLASAKVPSAG